MVTELIGKANEKFKRNNTNNNGKGSDVEGDQLTYAIASAPSNGTATISGNRVTYTPSTNYVGSDSFQWTASDGSLTSSAGTVNITVTNVNDLPTTSDVSSSTNEDTAKAITLTGADVDSGCLLYTSPSPRDRG